MKLYTTLLLCVLPSLLFAQNFSKDEIKNMEQQAQQIEIIRDKWGVAHVYGKTDALAVFGMLYAQCEDDFKRVELNYIEKLGRLAEIEGKRSIFKDLQIRLLIDSTQAINDYKNAAPWFKKLLNAYADGINYYLYKNKDVKPLLLTKYKPWYPFLWTDGSIGAISTGNLSLTELKKFYTKDDSPTAFVPTQKDDDIGSNGFAFAPKITKNGKAILYINPHTTYYFRPEIHIKSEEGLNSYGAVTWGQFFIYQGFNEFCGWMHTSSKVDVADMYAETIEQIGTNLFYRYEGKLFPVGKKNISIKYIEDGELMTRIFETYYTHHGPVMAIRDGKWISLKHSNQNPESLLQSWIRIKSKSFDEYQKAMDLTANASNNTVYADKAGNIAYWHGNFIPKRNPEYNWENVLDGSTSATEWRGLHPVSESVHLYNPTNGWLQNCNSTPFSVAGKNSPNPKDYPSYMAPDEENFRGINAVRLLNQNKKYNLNDVIAMAYNKYLPAFQYLIPALINAYDQLPKEAKPYKELTGPINTLRKWDYNTATNSVAATLAQEWGSRVINEIQKTNIKQGENNLVNRTIQFTKEATAEELLVPLATTIKDLETRFGKWQIPWGEINRFQRLTGNIVEQYDDNLPSYPVAYGSATWGQLASFKSTRFNTNKRYGYSGNSFVAVVEFGEKIKAKSLLAGGVSSNPKSNFFNNQSERFSKGEFKDILFYKEDILRNKVRSYSPGN